MMTQFLIEINSEAAESNASDENTDHIPSHKLINNIKQ